MNQRIIDPVDTDILEDELKSQQFLRHANKGGNDLYVVDGRKAPNVMREIGRLREISFRLAGGGTGKECDIDRFDTMDPPCLQLVVWSPADRLILGGYRFIIGPDIRLNEDGQPDLATSHMFHFSPKFIRDYLPGTMELGRSFVRPDYQSSRAGAKTLYVLDNLWDGLGALTVKHPCVKYLFGKVTMYPSYSAECRNLILYFLHKHFPDRECLVTPIEKLHTGSDNEALAAIFTGADFKEDYKILNSQVRSHGVNIPPLVNAYMSLSPTMKMFGTAINDEFGEVEESGIFLSIADIFEEKKERHIASYHPEEI